MHGKPCTDTAAESIRVSTHLNASRKSSLQYTAMLCACSYAHCLPGEILYRIASRLDLPSQVSLACTNKHNRAILQGDVQYMSWYEVDKAGFDERVQSEAFALNGIDLLPELPLCTAGEVAIFYDDFVQAEVAAITYSKGKYKYQVVNYFLDPAEEDSDQEHEIIPGHTALQRGDRVLFIQKGDKDLLHRILSNAPFGINSCNELSFGARLVLKSEKKAGFVDHCQCAQFCFDLMCKIPREGSAVLFICFAKASYEHYIPCIRIAKHITDGEVEWSVDNRSVQSPVKMHCECFPRATVQVQAHFTAGMPSAFGLPDMLSISLIPDPDFAILQQGLSFVYVDNLDAMSLKSIYEILDTSHDSSSG